MLKRYSLIQVLGILDRILAPVNSVSLKLAEKELQNLYRYDNFIDQFINLTFHPSISQQQKLLILSILKRYISTKNEVKIDLLLVNALLNILNNRQTTYIYKCSLLGLLNSIGLRSNIKQILKDMLIFKLKNGEINSSSHFLIFISKYICNGQSLENREYVKSIFPVVLQIGYGLLQLEDFGSMQYLIQTNKLFTLIIKKNQLESKQTQKAYLNGNICQFIYLCLQKVLKNTIEIILKTKTLILIECILTQVNCLLQHENQQFQILKWMKSIIQKIITHLVFINKDKDVQKWNQFTEYSFRNLLLVYNNYRFSMCTKTIEGNILLAIISSISLKKKHFDNYYFDPFEFISFIRQLMSPENEGSISLFDEEQDKEIKHEKNVYNYISLTLTSFCLSNQKIAKLLLENMKNVLNETSTLTQLPFSTSLILVGILKKQIKKRPKIHKQIIKIIINELKNRQIPTTYTQQPLNIHYVLIITVVEKYFEDLTINKVYQQQIFHLLGNILKIKRAETSLTLLAINILKQYIYKYNYQERLLNLLNQCLGLWSQTAILNRLIEVYNEFMTYIIPACNQRLAEFYRIGVMIVIEKMDNLIQSNHHFLINESLSLIMKYKKQWQQFQPSNSSRKILQNIIIQIHKKLTINKKKQCRAYLDMHLMELINKQIDNKCVFSQVLLFMVLDNYDSQLYKPVCEWIERMISDSTYLNTEIIDRLVNLFVVFAHELSQQGSTQINYKAIMFTQQLLIFHHHLLSQTQISLLYSNILLNQNYGLHQDYCIEINLLILKIIFYLIKQEFHQEDQKIITNLISQSRNNSNFGLFSRRSNQIFIILFIKMIQANQSQRQTLQLLKDLLFFMNKQINWKENSYDMIQQTIENYRYENYKYQNNKIDINQWEQIKKLIQMFDHGVWQRLVSGLSVQDRQILNKCLSCQKVGQKSRVIVKTKINQ